mgnify:CR=1 FL=1
MNNQNKINLLITGGAGFIGSNLVADLLSNGNTVTVLDNLSTGFRENIARFESDKKFTFIEGDIRSIEACESAVSGCEIVFHQAALGSVPRSIENPMRTNAVNVGGTVNVLHAAKEQGVERVILAFSSSTYGDHPGLPKVEGREGKPLSPYAVSKAAIEQYADVFGNTYGLNWIGLRYFNIFGPRQNPDNPYAAVIPIFCKAFIEGTDITINGDGETSRDFTYVANAIQANDKALFTDHPEALNQVYNTACGDQVTLNQMVSMLEGISGKKVKVNYGPERPGDVKHSRADISKITELLDYQPEVRFEEGLKEVYEWYKGEVEV